MPRPTRSAALLVAAFASASARTARADDVDDARQRAATRAERGDLPGAVAELSVLRDVYPQDYELALDVAAYESRRGTSPRAVAAYRAAVLRSPEAPAAHRGLAYELARNGACDDAERELAVVTVDVETERAVVRDQIARCHAFARASATHATLGATYIHVGFPGASVKQSADGASIDGALSLGAATLSATGRFTSIATRTDAVPSFTQSEGYLTAGYATSRAGASLTLAVIHDGSGTLGTSLHAGTALRWSPAGDLVLTVSASRYEDGNVFRASPSYRVPLGGGVSLTPAVAVQAAEGNAYANGSLTIALERARFGLFLGAKYGEEVRPAYLSSHVVYAIPEHVLWGAWGGAHARVTDRIGVRATYAFDQLASGRMHTLTLGPSFDF